jgi:uncharacterized protein YacL (UPF0231 family)
MSQQQNIFLITDSNYDYNETQLFGKLNSDIDWTIFDLASNGKKHYKPLVLKMTMNKILKKDFISAPGCSGIFSQKAIDLIGVEKFTDFKLFPLTINEAPFVAIYETKKTNCLDLSNCKYMELNTGNDGLYEIEKYAFHLDKIKSNQFFGIPKQNNFLFCTREIGLLIIENDLSLRINALLFEEEDIRKNKMEYHNTLLSISCKEKKNWIIEFEQKDALLSGKKVTDKTWSKCLPTKEKDGTVLELRRFQFLVSHKNIRQLAQIYIHLTFKTAEEIHKERGAIKPITISHPDLKWKAAVNEYEWERTLVAPYKDGINFIALLITREENPVLLQETIEMFQSLKFKSNLI